MGTADLLPHLRGIGLVLTLTATDALHVAPREALTDGHRVLIRAHRDALVLALQEEAEPRPSAPAHRGGNPLLTVSAGNDCHACGWDDAEIDTFLRREARFVRMGQAAVTAEHLAEWLVLRDRRHDDRRLCLECAALTEEGLCSTAARGRLSGASRRLQPVPVVLQRCPVFSEALRQAAP